MMLLLLLMHEPQDGKLGCLLFSLLGQQNGVDVWQDTTLRNGYTREQFIQFLVISDGQLQVSWDDSGLFVVTSSISSQFQNFSGQVFHDGSQINGGTSSDTFSIIAFAQQTMDTADWELKSSTGRTGLCLVLNFSSFASSWHFDLTWLDVIRTKFKLKLKSKTFYASTFIVSILSIIIFVHVKVGVAK